MDNSRVWIKEIRPIGLHGFKGERFLENLEPGLNLLYAPNAFGKSTLAKAITLVFQPKGLGGSGRITGVAQEGSTPQSLDVSKGHPTWPGFPEQRGRYLLDLAGLLEGMADEEKTAIGKLIGSGIRKIEPVKAKRTKRSEALARIREIRKSRQSVLEQENRLAGLQDELAKAKRATDVVRQVNSLLQKRELDDAIAELGDQIQALLEAHPGLEKLGANPGQQRTQIQANVDRCRRDFENALLSLQAEGIDPETPHRALKATDSALLETLIGDLRVELGGVAEAERQVTTSRAQCEKTKAALASLTGWDASGLPLFTQADVDRFRAIAQEEDDFKKGSLKAEAYARVLTRWQQTYAPKSDLNADAIRSAVSDWLNAEPRVAVTTDSASKGGLISVMYVAGIAILTLILALLPNTIPAMVKVIGLGVVSAVLAFLAGRSGKSASPAAAGETLAEARARAAREPLSKTSTPGDIMTLLQKVADAEALAKAEELIKGLQAADPATPKGRSLLQEKGIQAETIVLYTVSEALHAYQESLNNLGEREAELELRRAKVAALRDQVRAVFEANGFHTATVEVERETEGFKARLDKVKKLDEEKQHLKEAKEQLDGFWEANGLESVAEDERESALATRTELAKRLAELRAEHAGNLQTLSMIKTADIPAEWELHDNDGLLSIRHKQEQLAEQHTELAGQIAEIRQTIAGATHDEEYERLLRELSGEQQNREAQFQQHAKELVASRLNRFLIDQLTTQSVPPLIERANDYLSRFSNDRYSLLLSPDEKEDQLGNLRLLDRTSGRTQAFNELSTGTKMHSLIAIRLGLIDLQEESANGGTRKFPVVADEVLAVSDPVASRAVAEALREISRERQVIVFTNQPDDVAVFQQVEPNLVAKPIQDAEMPESAPQAVVIPEYGELPKARRLNLAIPLDAHDPVAFGTLAEEEPNLETMLRKLEPLREELKSRVLTWEFVQASGLISPTYAEQAELICQEANGSAVAFLDGLGRLKGFRTNTLNSVRDLLENQGILSDPPTLESLRSQVRDLLGADASGLAVEFFAILFRQSVS